MGRGSWSARGGNRENPYHISRGGFAPVFTESAGGLWLSFTGVYGKGNAEPPRRRGAEPATLAARCLTTFGLQSGIPRKDLEGVLGRFRFVDLVLCAICVISGWFCVRRWRRFRRSRVDGLTSGFSASAWAIAIPICPPFPTHGGGNAEPPRREGAEETTLAARCLCVSPALR